MLEHGIILGANHLRTGQLCRTIGTEAFHHGFDFVGTALTGLHHIDGLVERKSVFHVDFHQHIIECLALVFGPCTNLRQQGASRHGIFVAHEVFGHKAITFFATADILFFALGETHLTCNPLEAGIHIQHFDVVLGRNFLDEFGCYDGLHHKLIALHLSLCLTVHDDVVEENHASLIAIDKHPFPLIVLAGHTHTVGIGVAGHHDVGIELLGQIKRHGECLSILGVRALHGGEVAALHHLFGNGVNVFKAPHLQSLRNEHHTCAMQRSVNNFEILLTGDASRVDGEFLHFGEINIIDFLTDNLDKSGIAFKLDVSHTHFVHFVDDTLVVRSQHLRTIVPISLVSVVFLRVVAGGENDTALTAEMTDGKRHFGSGTHVIEQVDLDAVGREDVGRSLSEETAVVAAIVSHHHCDLLQVLEVLVEIVGETLCGSSHGVNVHAIGSGSHDAAQTSRTEFQGTIERIDEGRFVVSLDHCFHFGLCCFVIQRRVHPLLCHFCALFDEFLIFHNGILFDVCSFVNLPTPVLHSLGSTSIQ